MTRQAGHSRLRLSPKARRRSAERGTRDHIALDCIFHAMGGLKTVLCAGPERVGSLSALCGIRGGTIELLTAADYAAWENIALYLAVFDNPHAVDHDTREQLLEVTSRGRFHEDAIEQARNIDAVYTAKNWRP